MSDGEEKKSKAPAQASVPKVTVEEWAEKKGFLPHFFDGKAGGVGANGTALAGVARRANPEYWKFASARALCGWVIGKELTESEFDDAIKAAQGQVIQ